MLKKMKQLPVFLAIVIMAVCVLAGITLGNQKALDSAAAGVETILQEIATLSAQRAQKAGNLLVLVNRNVAGTVEGEALVEAIEAVKDATRPGRIAEANRKLTFATEAVTPLLLAAASSEDQKLATGVLDDMTSLDKQLARRARAYNEEVAAVAEVYNSLPMRFLIGGMPEVYQ